MVSVYIHVCLLRGYCVVPALVFIYHVALVCGVSHEVISIFVKEIVIFLIQEKE